MQLKESGCKSCPRFRSGTGYTTYIGKGVGKVLLVGDQPSHVDVVQETPLSPYSERGATLRRALALSGLDLDAFTYTNILRCSSQELFNAEAISHCARTYLRPLIERLKPELIVALGSTVSEELTGLLGRKTDVHYTRGYVVPGRGAAQGYDVKITYDPGVIRLGQMHLLGALAEDLSKSLSQVRREHQFTIHDGVRWAEDYLSRAKANPSLPIAYDIETLFSVKTNDEEEVRDTGGTITQIQFALDAASALVLPWCERTKEISAQFLALPNQKLSWNGYTFDQPRLANEDIRLAGQNTDLMCAWHWLEPDLPMNLSHATGALLGDSVPPWKHTMAQDMSRYGALDVITLQLAWPILRARLDTEGLYDGYLRFIEELQPVLGDMSLRGLPVDTDGRANFKLYISQQSDKLYRQIQTVVPSRLKACHPKDGFKRASGKNFRTLENGVVERLDTDTGEWVSLHKRVFGDTERYCLVKDFSVSSPKQIAVYAAAQGHKLPKVKREDGWSESSGKRELRKLSAKTGDEFYKLIVELRELAKIDSTYIEGWPLGPDGRIRTTFHFGPATGQLGSRQPNIMNVPKPGLPGQQTDLALAFRKTIAATPGHTLLELDMSGFHAQTLAFCAQDPVYARVAAIDPHSFLAAHMLKLSGVDGWLDLPNEELISRLGWVKKNHEDIRNKKAKPGILGIGFGMGANKLYRLNEDSFDSVAEAKNVHAVLKAIFPRIFAWQSEIRNEAHIRHKLTSPYGCVRRFWDVFTWDHDRGEWKPGSQSEEAIAFLPANLAHCHIKEVMLRLQERGLLDKYELVNFIHDALLFNCPNELLEEAIYEVRAEMEAKSTTLVDPVVAPAGFWVKADVMVGPNWAQLEKLK